MMKAIYVLIIIIVAFGFAYILSRIQMRAWIDQFNNHLNKKVKQNEKTEKKQ